MENELVDFLRERAEEEDLDSVLITSMGKYTKKSVQEYVAQLKKQQQTINKRFNEDLQKILAEKEVLTKEVEYQKSMVVQSETQYRVLAESLEELKSMDGEANAENILKMKKRLAKQEETITILEAQAKAEAQRQEQLKIHLENKELELEQSMQSNKVTSELLQMEKEKLLKALKESKDLSKDLVLAQNELTFLRTLLSEGEMNRMKIQIDSLLTEAKTREDIIAQRKEEVECKQQQVAVLEEQNAMLQVANEHLQQTADALMLQNQKLEAYQKELSEKLRQAFEDNLAMLNARTEMQLENVLLSRKLEENQSKLSWEKVKCEE